MDNLDIVNSEWLQANSILIVEADGENWKCLVSDDSYVQELTRDHSGSQGSGSDGFDYLVGEHSRDADPQPQSRGYNRVATERSDKNHFWG